MEAQATDADLAVADTADADCLRVYLVVDHTALVVAAMDADDPGMMGTQATILATAVIVAMAAVRADMAHIAVAIADAESAAAGDSHVAAALRQLLVDSVAQLPSPVVASRWQPVLPVCNRVL